METCDSSQHAQRLREHDRPPHLAQRPLLLVDALQLWVDAMRRILALVVARRLASAFG